MPIEVTEDFVAKGMSFQNNPDSRLHDYCSEFSQLMDEFLPPDYSKYATDQFINKMESVHQLLNPENPLCFLPHAVYRCGSEFHRRIFDADISDECRAKANDAFRHAIFRLQGDMPFFDSCDVPFVCHHCANESIDTRFSLLSRLKRWWKGENS